MGNLETDIKGFSAEPSSNRQSLIESSHSFELQGTLTTILSRNPQLPISQLSEHFRAVYETVEEQQAIELENTHRNSKNFWPAVMERLSREADAHPDSPDVTEVVASAIGFPPDSWKIPDERLALLVLHSALETDLSRPLSQIEKKRDTYEELYLKLDTVIKETAQPVH